MKFLNFLFALLVSSFGFSQLNMTQIGYLDVATLHSAELNDIWGYTDEEGNEYALVGTTKGVSIVDISEPTTPTEVAWVSGMTSIWRDIKTVGDYAYVTTEASEGLLIIDLSPLPGSTVLPTAHYSGPSSDPWHSAHNVFADENGVLYVAGTDRGSGGVIILDVTTDPLNPAELGVYDLWYAHDIYVRNDTGYVSHVYDGYFSIVDLTDKSAPALINTHTTPSGVSHNAWLSMDGNTLFTTDEVANGSIASYDVSDPMSISLLDAVQSHPGLNIIPHNCHVLGNYLVSSYYVDGVVVHDISNPSSMVEVANFDTSPAYSGGTYNGCWGVYPFFESEMIVASDIENGLYVLKADFLFAGYLQGIVTDIDTELPINDATITITGPSVVGHSHVLGDYSVGTFEEGTFDVTFTKPDYYPQTFSIDFVNGEVDTLDVQMDKIPNYNVTITVLDAETLAPVEGADVRIQHTLESASGLTDASGNVTIDLYYEDNYEIYAGKWGYVTDCMVDVYLASGTAGITMYVDKGIYDDFTFDFGWNVTGDAVSGMWEREKPVGVYSSGHVESPFDDVTDDCADLAYLTGNGSVVSMGDEVDSGSVILTSPIFDLSGYVNPGINFSTFFTNLYGASPPNDSMTVYLANGSGFVPVLVRNSSSTSMGEWVNHQVQVSDFTTASSTMQLIVYISDDDANPNLVEGGFDHFYVSELSLNAIKENTGSNRISILPNPFNNELNLTGVSEGTVHILDLSGREVAQFAVAEKLDVGLLEKGMYLLVVSDELGRRVHTEKIVKQ